MDAGVADLINRIGARPVSLSVDRFLARLLCLLADHRTSILFTLSLYVCVIHGVSVIVVLLVYARVCVCSRESVALTVLSLARSPALGTAVRFARHPDSEVRQHAFDTLHLMAADGTYFLLRLCFYGICLFLSSVSDRLSVCPLRPCLYRRR